MVEDLKILTREFDIMALLNPASVEQFMMTLILLLMMVGLVLFAWKIVQHLLGG